MTDDRPLDSIEACDDVLSEFPDSLVALRTKAELLVAQDEFGSAAELYSILDKKHPASPSGLQGLLNLATTRQGEPGELILLSGRAAALFPDHTWWRKVWVTSRRNAGQLETQYELDKAISTIGPTLELLVLQSDVRLASNDLNGARKSLRIADELFPDRPAALKALLQVELDYGTAAELSAVAQKARERFPSHSWWHEAMTQHIEATAGKVGVEQFFSDLLREDPTSVTVAARLARIADRDFDIDGAIDRWRTAYSLAPERLWVLEGLLQALLRGGLYEEAEEVIEKGHATSALGDDVAKRLGAQLSSARYEFDVAAQAIIELLEADTATDEALRACRTLVSDLSHIWEGPDLCEQAITAIQARPDVEAFAATLAQLHLSLGDFARADHNISKVPEDHALALMFASWQAVRKGDFDRAKELGWAWATSRQMPPLDAPIIDFRTISTASPPAVGAMTAIVPVRNEAAKLPSFFAHHRAIGVEHFVVIDNGSTDGTVDFLLDQRDTTLITTTDDFIPAGSGTRWVNHVLDQMPRLQWVLVLDADELFVYNGYESKTVSELCCELDEEGAEVVASFMLDMHPVSLDDAANFEPGSDLLAHSPMFIDQFRFTPSATSPYTDVCGGVRAVALGMRRQLRKAPLIRGDRGIRYLWNHETTPARVSRTPTALLHFKFAGDPIERAKLEVEWSRWRYFANRERQLAASSMSTKKTASRRWEGSASLQFPRGKLSHGP